MATLCLIVLIAFLGVVVGFASGIWWLKAEGSTSAIDTSGSLNADPQQDSSTAPNPEVVRIAEHAMMAFQRIQDVAHGIAGDAGVHALRVEAITAELQSIATGQSDVSSDAVLTAIQQIADVNLHLKERLAITEKQLESQATELHSYETEARTDSLTGLANRRAFDDEMRRQCELWQRNKTPFTLLIFDIDKFKNFNDSHGHQAGDEVLRSVGKLLTKTARQMDVPCRYGGEEFAVVLPATDIREARVAAERFRTAIESAVVNFGSQKLSVTASIGVAQISVKEDPALLIRRADEALYRCKEAGRNCAYWHDGQQCLPVNADSAQFQGERVKKTVQEVITTFERLPSKKPFLETLQCRIAECQRFGMLLSVIQLKLEDFPEIKREYGKAFARELLDSVAQRAQMMLRQMDMLARYDDGEFIVMLPRCPKQEAVRIARRLQDSIAEGYNPSGKARLGLSAQYGVVQLDSKETAATMMARVAQALEDALASKNLSLAGSSA
jgi:diguanylate cyclase